MIGTDTSFLETDYKFHSNLNGTLYLKLLFKICIFFFKLLFFILYGRMPYVWPEN